MMETPVHMCIHLCLNHVLTQVEEARTSYTKLRFSSVTVAAGLIVRNELSQHDARTLQAATRI